MGSDALKSENVIIKMKGEEKTVADDVMRLMVEQNLPKSVR